MAFTFRFYADPALTTLLPSPLVFVQADTSPTPAVRTIWFGSPDASAKCQATASPGTASITVTPVDSASGTGSPASDIKLALSVDALATAVSGAALDLPDTVFGGSENAVAIVVQVLDSTHAGGAHLDLSLTTNPLVQT